MDRPRFAEYRLTVLIYFVLALVLRLWGLDHLSLWLDEGATVHFSEQGFMQILRDCFSHEPNPPLYYAFMHGWIEVFGDSEFALRLPSAIFGAMTVALTFLTGARFVSYRAGVIAATFGLCVPIQMVYSQEARSYGLFSFLSLLAIYLTPLNLRWRNKSSPWVFLLVEIAALYTHFFAILLLTSQIIYLYCKWLSLGRQKRDSRPVKQIILILTASCMAAAPWYLCLVRNFKEFHSQVQWIDIYPHSNPFLFIESYFGVGKVWLNEWSEHAWPFTGLVIVLGLLLTWLYNGRKALKLTSKRIRLELTPATLLVLWVLLSIPFPLLIGNMGPRFFVLRYGLAAASALYILAAGVIDGALSGRVGFRAIILVLAVIAFFQLKNYNSNFHKQDWRAAVSHIQSNDPNLPIVVLPKRYMTQRYYNFSVVDYYARRLLTNRGVSITYVDQPEEIFELPNAARPTWLIMIDWYNDDLMKDNPLWKTLLVEDRSRYQDVYLMKAIAKRSPLIP